eukprot:SAG22_NODE_1058_length_5769_cov_6.433510_3_plen_106_part_00
MLNVDDVLREGDEAFMVTMKFEVEYTKDLDSFWDWMTALFTVTATLTFIECESQKALTVCPVFPRPSTGVVPKTVPFLAVCLVQGSTGPTSSRRTSRCRPRTPPS